MCHNHIPTKRLWWWWKQLQIPANPPLYLCGEKQHDHLPASDGTSRRLHRHTGDQWLIMLFRPFYNSKLEFPTLFYNDRHLWQPWCSQGLRKRANVNAAEDWGKEVSPTFLLPVRLKIKKNRRELSRQIVKVEISLNLNVFTFPFSGEQGACDKFFGHHPHLPGHSSAVFIRFC